MTYPIHQSIPTNTLSINDTELRVIKSALYAFSKNPAAPLYEVSVAESMLELIK